MCTECGRPTRARGLCNAHYTAWYRATNPNARAGDIRRRHEVRDYLRAQKKVPCADCGQSYPHFVMDFDHRPDEIKLFELGRSMTRTLDVIKSEIAKCDVVCSNCHRIRTWDENGRIDRLAMPS